MDQEIIRFSCPEHGIVLNLQDETLICPQGCSFPIKNGIPRFVSDPGYSAAFGLQWKTYRTTQLDSVTGLPLTEERLRRCLGEGLWENLEGKKVLEAGCGAGRFTEILLKKGAIVHSIDLSDAVEANQENFPQSVTHSVAQANIYSLPFNPEQFDFVICLGVVQHTPNSDKTLFALYKQVKPGGWMVIDHYKYVLGYYTRTAPLFRFFLKRMDRDKSLPFVTKMTKALLPLHKRLRNFRPGQMLLSRVSPLTVYYHSFPELSDQWHEDMAFLDTYDALTDYYKWYRTKGQIHDRLTALGLTNLWCEYGGNGVEARGQRPLVEPVGI